MRALLVSCEHGGNWVPAEFRKLVKIPRSLLSTHRGYDIGALKVAKYLAADFKCPLVENQMTRLLIDFNRSLGNPKIFSEFSKTLRDAEKRKLVRIYTIYREKVVTALQALQDPVHISVHSFTSNLDGKLRDVDFGILYDPSRSRERHLSFSLKRALVESGFSVRMNYPYKGTSDGFTTYLRERLGPGYIGIELEINQDLIGQPKLPRRVAESLRSGIVAAAT